MGAFKREYIEEMDRRQQKIIRLYENGKATDIIFEPEHVEPCEQHDPELRELLTKMREEYYAEPF